MTADARPFEHGGVAHDVVERGEGNRPVVLLHELAGLSEACLGLGDELARARFHVYMPVLYGSPGDASVVKGMLRARFCLWRELRIFCSGRDSPLATWLRALCRRVAADTRAERVAVIGMCMTGGLALAALAEHRVGAAVASQPSLPFTPPRGVPWSSRARADLGMSEQTRDAAAASTARVIALRYRDDWMSPPQRMETIRARFGTERCATERQEGREVRRCGRLTTVEVDGARHSVLTEHCDRPARDIVLAFLGEALG